MRYTISTNINGRWQFITEEGELTDDASAWGVLKGSQSELEANKREFLLREGISEEKAIEDEIEFMIENWKE